MAGKGTRGIADSRQRRKFKRPLKNLDDVKTLKSVKGDVLLFGHILHGDPEISACASMLVFLVKTASVCCNSEQAAQ